jgi:hypothetical protein
LSVLPHIVLQRLKFQTPHPSARSVGACFAAVLAGHRKIVAQEGNKLEIDFEHAGLKKVLDSFVSAG